MLNNKDRRDKIVVTSKKQLRTIQIDLLILEQVVDHYQLCIKKKQWSCPPLDQSFNDCRHKQRLDNLNVRLLQLSKKRPHVVMSAYKRCQVKAER